MGSLNFKEKIRNINSKKPGHPGYAAAEFIKWTLGIIIFLVVLSVLVFGIWWLVVTLPWKTWLFVAAIIVIVGLYFIWRSATQPTPAPSTKNREYTGSW